MIELDTGDSLNIQLKEDAQGRDRVELVLQQCTLALTPHQARVLATELIMAVNRAEVRNNLKNSQNMVRGAQGGGEHKRGLFAQAFAR